VKVSAPKATVEVAEGKEEKEDPEGLENKVAILITEIYQPAVSGIIFVLLSPITVIASLLPPHHHTLHACRAPPRIASSLDRRDLRALPVPRVLPLLVVRSGFYRVITVDTVVQHQQASATAAVDTLIR
jgi:hypothetical protein